MRHELLDAVKALSLRHAHMIGISRKSLIAGFSVDHARILATTRAVRTRLRPDSLFRVRTPAGTDLEVRLDASMRWAEHVGVIRPGKWENLPSGKLTTCPGLRERGLRAPTPASGGSSGRGSGSSSKTPVRVELDGIDVQERPLLGSRDSARGRVVPPARAQPHARRGDQPRHERRHPRPRRARSSPTRTSRGFTSSSGPRQRTRPVRRGPPAPSSP